MSVAELIEADLETDAKARRSAADEAASKVSCQEYCGRGAVVVITKGSSEIKVVPVRCKTWRCPHCGPVLARQWGETIAGAEPERFITLTADAARWPRPDLAYDKMREQWPKLVRLIRKTYGPMEYAVVWEMHESGYPHMHIAQKGCYIPQRWLSAQWDRLGVGRVVDIRRIDNKRGAARYLTKYMLKTAGRQHDKVGLTRVVTTSRGWSEQTLHQESPTDDVRVETAHTFAHPSVVINMLIYEYGFRLTSDPSAAVLTVEAGPETPYPLPWQAILSRSESLGRR